MASLMEDFNLWLFQASVEVGIPLDVFIFLLCANIVLLTIMILIILNKIWVRYPKNHTHEPESVKRKAEVASGTLSELIEEQ